MVYLQKQEGYHISAASNFTSKLRVGGKTETDKSEAKQEAYYSSLKYSFYLFNLQSYCICTPSLNKKKTVFTLRIVGSKALMARPTLFLESSF